MSKKEIIRHIDLMSRIARDSLNNCIRQRKNGAETYRYDEGRLSAFNIAVGLLAKELNLATMIWDRPITIAEVIKATASLPPIQLERGVWRTPQAVEAAA